MAEFEQVRYSTRDHIATITLHRPEARNAATPQMLDELVAAFDRTDNDDSVRCVVVTGSGDDFCVGADLAALRGIQEQRDPNSVEVDEDPGGRVALRIFRSLKPVIAAINGPAVGVGLTMTLPMDFRLATDRARFGFVFARRGILLEAGSGWFLPRLVGISQAAEWVYSGRVFPAAEALDGGLLRSVHPAAELVPRAYALAAEIANNCAPLSVALSRQMLWRMLTAPDPMSAHVAASRALNILGGSADAREGIASFLEKRPPRFTGSVSTDLPDIFGGSPPGWALDPA